MDDDLHNVHNKLWEMLTYLPEQMMSHEAEGLAKQVKRAADDLYERILKKGPEDTRLIWFNSRQGMEPVLLRLFRYRALFD